MIKTLACSIAARFAAAKAIKQEAGAWLNAAEFSMAAIKAGSKKD